MPGTLQAGLRQLFGSAASGLESASVSVCINLSKRQRVGADCQDKAISSSRALSLRSSHSETGHARPDPLAKSNTFNANIGIKFIMPQAGLCRTAWSGC